LKNGYDIFIEMDADLSHDPQVLPEILARLRCHDIVIGSRYVHGGTVTNWNFWRLMVSRGGSLYARLVLGVSVHDMTGGFNGWRRYVLEGIGLDNIESEGYAFQIELKYRALRLGFTWVEIPITFMERREGQSKMSWRIVMEAILRVWLLAARMRFRRPT
jgi:dolichol-phosphate mannosyltransferase